MKKKHIIELLESVPFQSLAIEQLTAIREHLPSCDECSRAFEAAQVASLVVKERARVVVEPSPFFQSRVLAALRERQAENVPALLKLWRAAGALVSSMAVTTAALAALSFVAPGPTVNDQQTIALNSYSAEGVILDQNSSDDQLSYDQVLNTIYADDDEAK
ncbi:MAG: hypothetical protein C5B55_12115 [Blastocatellia bacterium]|nr:MAG: hypothetical protein C5B55_12115 [Blastocatellia bacterium]